MHIGKEKERKPIDFFCHQISICQSHGWTWTRLIDPAKVSNPRDTATCKSMTFLQLKRPNPTQNRGQKKKNHSFSDTIPMNYDILIQLNYSLFCNLPKINTFAVLF